MRHELHVITDTTVQSRFSAVELGELCAAAGATTIQLRDKRVDDDTFLQWALALVPTCQRYDCRLVINDRLHLARTANCGVHLGQTDANIADARPLLDAGLAVGASVSNPKQAIAAQAAGATYLGCGHVYATTSKSKSSPPIGLDGLTAVTSVAKVPVIAIGGVTLDAIEPLVAAGASGVAVISAVCTADDPAEATAQFVAALEATQ